MYDICHPVYYNMSQLGCNDQVKLTTAFYVYMELCEVKRYWDVDFKYYEELQLFYLEARKTKNSALDTFIPWPAMQNITLDFISDIQHALDKEKLTFVFKEGDTTSVYYNICAGIVKPLAPEKTKIFKQREDKKFELEKEINRNTSNLYERALLIDNEESDNNEESNSCIKKEKSDSDFFTAMDTSFSDKAESLDYQFSNDFQETESKEQNISNCETSERLLSSENTMSFDDSKQNGSSKNSYYDSQKTESTEDSNTSQVLNFEDTVNADDFQKIKLERNINHSNTR